MKPESLLELMARLDKLKAGNRSSAFGGAAWHAHPRISKTVAVLIAYVEEDVRLERGTACVDLLARIDGDEL